MTASPKKKYNLEDIALQIAKHVEIKDRTYHFKTYKQCFLGTDVVRFFVSSGLVKNAKEAVDLGNMLVKEKYIKHVVDEHDFKNEKLFYEYTEIMKFRASNNPHLSVIGQEEGVSISDEDLEEIAFSMQWGLKTYPRCFIGEELVKWLVGNGYAKGVNHAVAIGNLLMEKRLVHHVTYEHQFKNENLFYQLSEENSEEKSLSDLNLTDIEMAEIITQMKKKVEIKTRQVSVTIRLKKKVANP
ncbi:hypothetical protein RFI_26966 [Reticulomyxa filosa]|uniref:DEP domain-containing protein n=1 Tax=Reticulomyxa filosa TaxID=46433 RepID=X6M966_RETFI|nr:hypothetical protein RFI_26966 [Reticulomyxa filosa]|eukprot:ETO10409.1 hypothetical protein RFI_26966 [Reticulomyxa filosa]